MNCISDISPELYQISKIAAAGYQIDLHVRNTSAAQTICAFPQDWQSYYSANAYALRDPTIGWGLSTEGTTRWSKMQSADPHDILVTAKEFGLHFGCTVSCGQQKSRSIASFAREDREFEDTEIQGLHTAIVRLHDRTKPPETLTPAQAQALIYIAKGDRQKTAAARLGISESAFKARLISARERLLARTTAEAIEKAKEYRLI